MQEFTITDLARVTRATFQASNIANDIRSFKGVSTDSRSVKKGDCFFAVAGESFDGHDYVADAFAKGAVCAVVSKDIDEEKSAGSWQTDAPS